MTTYRIQWQDLSGEWKFLERRSKPFETRDVMVVMGAATAAASDYQRPSRIVLRIGDKGRWLKDNMRVGSWPCAPRPSIKIKLAYRATFDDDPERAPVWVKAGLWAATATPDQFPDGPCLCGLCQHEHTEEAAATADYRWPDGEQSTIAFCPACANLPDFPRRLEEQLRSIGARDVIEFSEEAPVPAGVKPS